jgi:hypothetical protein
MAAPALRTGCAASELAYGRDTDGPAGAAGACAAGFTFGRAWSGPSSLAAMIRPSTNGRPGSASVRPSRSTCTPGHRVWFVPSARYEPEPGGAGAGARRRQRTECTAATIPAPPAEGPVPAAEPREGSRQWWPSSGPPCGTELRRHRIEERGLDRRAAYPTGNLARADPPASRLYRALGRSPRRVPRRPPPGRCSPPHESS